MKVREILIQGFKVELYRFSYASFLYPSFNGDAEFFATKEGYKKLCHYLRFIKFARERFKELIH